MEKHVTNLDISKRLEELGVEYITEFEWYQDETDNHYWVTNDPGEYAGELDRHICPAFLASELGELLPWEFRDGIDRGRFVIEKSFGTKPWKATYVDFGRFANSSSEDTMADTIGKLLIYLLENKLINL